MARSHPIWTFLKKHLGVFAVLVVASIAGLWFVGSLFFEFLYFNDPRNQDEALKDWMTPRYVVLSYDLPRSVVAELLGLTSEDQRGMPMRDIATLNGLTLEELTAKVRDGAEVFRDGGDR